MKSHSVPFVDIETIKSDGPHFTMREERGSYRKIVHRKVAEFDIDHFDSKYLPVRESSNYRERKNRIGYLWMAKSGKLRAFESLLEQSILLDLDRDESLARVWTQPFRVEGIDPNRGNRRVYPTPDLLVEYTDGEIGVIEVKPQHRLNAPKPEKYGDNIKAYATAVKNWERLHASLSYQRSVFKELGWEVTTRSELSPERRANLAYLSPYRRPLQKQDTLADQVIEQATSSGPMRLIDLAESVQGGFIAAMPVILHLVWHRRLELDIEKPINEYSSVYVPSTAMSVAA